MNVYIPWTWFATQWPCPNWFHVPLSSEWEWLKTIMDWLSLTTWNDWKINLHLPFTGNRNFASGNAVSQGSDWYYWSATPRIDIPRSSYTCYISSSSIEANVAVMHMQGNPIRPFKDNFVKPTSTWTVIQWTLGSAWIFRDTVNWLISITGDWVTWYTISDKNLWATTVYSNWDTLSQSNCGYYYQWWNNYWFPWTWSITTSSTQVDASWYWPWNYYSSSTFIAISWNVDWTSVTNNNLRWWEDGNVQVMSELKNAYIGDWLS